MEVEMLVPACLNTISVLYTRVSEPKIQKEYNQQEYFVYTCLQLIWSCMISLNFVVMSSKIKFLMQCLYRSLTVFVADHKSQI